MHVTVLQRDIFQQVLDGLHKKYAGYRILSVSESWSESDQQSLIEHGVWHGNYENLSASWEFSLCKVAGDYAGPNRFTVLISPVFDIVFADIYPNVFFIEVGFHGFPDRDSRPALYEVGGIEGKIWDVHYFYDAALRDL